MIEEQENEYLYVSLSAGFVHECRIAGYLRNASLLVDFRVDELVTCDAWKQQKRVSAEEGIVATAYERKHGEWR